MTETQIVQRLHLAVRGTAGVDSLVPSMKTALDRLRSSQWPATSTANAAADPAGDGITVTLSGGSVAAVLDITVTTTSSVLATAVAVHTAASKVLTAAHPGEHVVTVNVLRLEPGPSDATQPEASPE